MKTSGTVTEAPALGCSVTPFDVVSSRKALDDTFRAKRSTLLRIATRITRNSADAEDAIQWAFLRAYERAAQIHPERLWYWLITTVRRLSIDQLRQRAIHPGFIELQHLCHWQDGRDGPWLRVTMDDLESFALMLSDPLQRTFKLWWDGASYNSIARALCIPVGTVATRLLRAKLQLRAMNDGWPQSPTRSPKTLSRQR